MALKFLNNGYFAGKVGIGTESPGNTLHVFKNATIGVITSPTVANAGFRIQDSGANMYVDGNSFVIDTTGYLTTTGNNDFDIGTNSTSRIKITGSGNVGIGTTSPNAILETSKEVDGNQVGALLTNTRQAGTADSVSLNFGLGRTADGYIRSVDAIKLLKEQQWTGTPSTVDAALVFSTVSNETVSERMRISSAGNVGIGVTPRTISNYKVLDISGSGGSGGYIGLSSGSTQQGELYSHGGGVDLVAIGAKQTRFFTNGSQQAVITSDGKFGIGTTSPQSKLQVAYPGNVNGGSMLLGQGGSGNSKWSFLAGTHYNQASGSGNGAGSAGVALIGSFANSTTNVVYIGGGPYEINAATQIKFYTNSTNLSTQGGTHVMNIANDGGIRFNTYDGTNKTGTPTYMLGTDASGNVVKVLGSGIPGVPAGSGTLNTIPLWTPDGDTLGNSIITQPNTGVVRVSGNSVYFSVTDTSAAARNIDIGHWVSGQTNIESQGGTLSIGTQSNHNIVFETNGSTKATILSGGNVGIGVTGPNAKLEVSYTNTGIGAIVGNTTHNSQLQIYTAAAGKNSEIWFGDASDADVGKIDYDHANDSMSFFIGATKRLSFDSAGTMLLGDTTTAYQTIFFDPTPSTVYGNGTLQIQPTTSPGSGIAQFTTNFADRVGGGTTKHNVRVGGTVTATDFIGGSGAYLPLAGGTMTGTNGVIFPDNFNLKIGTGSDLQIYHSGTESKINNDVGNLSITNFANDSDIIFSSDNGSGGTTEYFRVDGGEVETLFSKTTHHSDNIQARFGDAGDLRIYHDGSNSYIKDVGTGSIIVNGDFFRILNSAGNSQMFRCDANDSVQLYYNNSVKLVTTNTGVTLTGAATATTFLGDLNGTINTATTGVTQVNAINNTTIATTAYVNNKIALIPAGLVFQGTWNAATNTPTLTSGSGTTGNFYIVSVAGSTNLDGITDWKVGDWAVFIEQGASDQWEKIDNSSVLDGFGTGQSVTKWDGSGTSNTLTNGPITFSGNNSTFAGDVTVNGSHLTLANGTTSAAATDYLYIGGSGLASADAAIYIGNGGGNTTDGYGYRIYYSGTGQANNNKLIFKSENYQSAEVDMLTFTADGKSTFSQDATFAGDVNITQTTDVGVLNTTNLDNGSAVGLSLTYPTSNVAAGDGLAIAIGIAGRGRSYIANSNITNNLDASNLEFYTEGGGVINKVLTLGTEKNATFAGNVTINHDSGDSLLLTKSTTEPSLRFEGDTDKDFVLTVSGETFTITQNNGATDILTLDHDTKNATFAKNVGIGGVLPLSNGGSGATVLGVHDAVGSGWSITKYTNTTTGTAAADGSIFGIIGSNAYVFNYETNGSVIFGTASSERMRINSNGNVGIGTTSPQAALHVAGSFDTNSPTGNGVLMGFYSGTHGYMQLNGPSGGYIDFSTSGTDHKGRILYDNTGNYLRLDTNGSERMRINSAGNVGIDTTNPNYKLSVSGGINAGGKVTYTKQAGSLNTTGYAVAGLTTSTNGQSAGFTFTCFGHLGGYQKIVYSCYNAGGNWYASKVIDEGTNQLDVVASANSTTITFTFKSISGTMSYTPRVTVEAVGTAINSTYA